MPGLSIVFARVPERSGIPLRDPGNRGSAGRVRSLSILRISENGLRRSGLSSFQNWWIASTTPS